MTEENTREPLAPPPGYGNINMPKKAESGINASAMLKEAADIVAGDRNVTHGEKADSFGAIAQLQTAYLRCRKDPNGPIRPSDVVALMVLTKLMRAEWGQFIRDHAVDAAGYAAIWGELKSLDLPR